MSLSNTSLFDELQESANGDLAILYRAIALTPERPSGMFRQKSKNADDVKKNISELLREQAAANAALPPPT